MKTKIVIAVLLSTIAVTAVAQNYTSTAAGTWTTASNWNNTSGWGASTPPTDGSQGSGTITMNHNMTINSGYTDGSATLNIASAKTLTVNGSMTLNGGSVVNVSGNLTIMGDLSLNGYLNILPGGVVTVNGTVYVYNANYLMVGTNAGPPPYADLIVKSDIQQKSSGDVTLNKNARVAVFGSVIGDNGGGTTLTLNQGAEMYVDGDISYTGGSDAITNNNSTSPYGLYVNGTTSNTGGGSSTTTNKATKTTMSTTNPTFATWVNSVKGSVMPVTILFFEVNDVNQESVVLKWATDSEENFDYFVIESSNGGTVFNEIGRVSGNGTTNKRNDYTFEATNPAIGKTYYRLKSVDFNGYTETFKVVSATYSAEKTVKVFPNPVVDSNVNIDFNFMPGEQITVSLTNMNGMEMYRQVISEQQNLLPLSVDPGTYLIKIQSTEVASVSRIVIK
jgi:hypothetical protein